MSALPVTSATGMPSARSRASRLELSSPPRCTSSSTTSGRSASTALSASCSVPASRTEKPSSSRLTRQSILNAASSSTTRAVGLCASIRGAIVTITIGQAASTTRTPEPYGLAMGELWPGLPRPRPRLDRVAGDPLRLDEDDAARSLRRLQYALHSASELAYGLAPPAAARTAHAELADALRCARDATAEVAEAVSVWGAAGVEPLLHEWRGALFRVRLARLPRPPPGAPPARQLGPPRRLLRPPPAVPP